MKNAKREEFINLMRWYINTDIENQIDRLHHLFTDKVCKPETDIFHAFNLYYKYENEMIEVVNKKEKIENILMRFNDKDIALIQDLVESKYQQKELAEKYGVTQGGISCRIGFLTRKFFDYYCEKEEK